MTLTLEQERMKSVKARYRRWLALDGRGAAPDATYDDCRFYEHYPLTDEYRTLRTMVADLGEDWLYDRAMEDTIVGFDYGLHGTLRSGYDPARYGVELPPDLTPREARLWQQCVCAIQDIPGFDSHQSKEPHWREARPALRAAIEKLFSGASLRAQKRLKFGKFGGDVLGVAPGQRPELVANPVDVKQQRLEVGAAKPAGAHQGDDEQQQCVCGGDPGCRPSVIHIGDRRDSIQVVVVFHMTFPL